MPKKAPNTRIVRVRVTDTVTYSREKVVEVEIPRDADEEQVRSAAIAKAENDGRNWDEEQVDNTPYEVEPAEAAPSRA
jgi:hypothetical protein